MKKRFMGDRLRMCRLERSGKKESYESARSKIVRKIGHLYTHMIYFKNARREKQFMDNRLRMFRLKNLGRQKCYNRAKEKIERYHKCLLCAD